MPLKRGMARRTEQFWEDLDTYIHPEFLSKMPLSMSVKVDADWYEADIENDSLGRDLQLIRKPLILTEIIEKAEAELP